jgi:hypothetical protein
MYYVKILLYRGMTGSNVGECQNNFVVLCIRCEVCSMFRLGAGHFCNFIRRVRKLERQKISFKHDNGLRTLGGPLEFLLMTFITLFIVGGVILPELDFL